MSDKVQVALAEDIAEAEEIQAILDAGGIEDAPQKVLVGEASLEAARHAIEAMTEADADIPAD